MTAALPLPDIIAAVLLYRNKCQISLPDSLQRVSSAMQVQSHASERCWWPSVRLHRPAT